MGSFRRYWLCLVGNDPGRGHARKSQHHRKYFRNCDRCKRARSLQTRTVTATERQTGVKNRHQNGWARGFYNFPSLAIGTYDVDIEQAGFKSFRKNRNCDRRQFRRQARRRSSRWRHKPKKMEITSDARYHRHAKHAKRRRYHGNQNDDRSAKRTRLHRLAFASARSSPHRLRLPSTRRLTTGRRQAELNSGKRPR